MKRSMKKHGMILWREWSENLYAYPWEEIDLKVYENHMSLQSVHQLQALNELMKGQFHTYDVNTAMILGIAGGNGLEHIYKEKFEKEHKQELDKLQEIISYRKSKEEKTAKFNAEDKKKAKKKLEELQEKIRQHSWQSAKKDFDYPIFMAEAEFVGITSTGETGENVPNELIDIYENKEDIFTRAS